MDFQARRDRLCKALKKAGVDALLVTDFTNVTYLTGFTGDDSYLLVRRDGESVLSDPRYTTQLGEECPDLDLNIRPPGVAMSQSVTRVVRAVARVIRELERRAKNPDEGWDERDALKHWAQICGPCAISRYLHVFLLNEMRLRPASELAQWQSGLAKLFGYVLRHGMPMEQLQLGPFRDTLFQARNAEEALLVALNACSSVTAQVSAFEHPNQTAFGAWFKRIQGQRIGAESVLAASCLSFLDLSGTNLHIGDFYGATLRSTKLQRVQAAFSCFVQAGLENADLGGAWFVRANLEGANLEGANLEGANLEGANLQRANLHGANLQGANLEGANLQGANLEGANLEGAHLKGTKLPPKARRPAEGSGP